MRQPATTQAQGERFGDWMQTYTGLKFWPLDPRPEEVDIEDIAHALSLTCRFNGHCRRFYSVAQHSVLVGRLLDDPDSARWGLLHDAAEAYLQDAVRPIKDFIGFNFGVESVIYTPYRRVEKTILKTIARAFDLPWPMPPEVAEADEIVLATERRDVMAEWGHRWTVNAEPASFTIVPLPPDAAKRLFLRRFRELFG